MLMGLVDLVGGRMRSEIAGGFVFGIERDVQGYLVLDLGFSRTCHVPMESVRGARRGLLGTVGERKAGLGGCCRWSQYLKSSGGVRYNSVIPFTLQPPTHQGFFHLPAFNIAFAFTSSFSLLQTSSTSSLSTTIHKSYSVECNVVIMYKNQHNVMSTGREPHCGRQTKSNVSCPNDYSPLNASPQDVLIQCSSCYARRSRLQIGGNRLELGAAVSSQVVR